jgi:hypothetical protein
MCVCVCVCVCGLWFVVCGLWFVGYGKIRLLSVELVVILLTVNEIDEIFSPKLVFTAR